MTALDEAHAAMEAAPEDDALRLQFYDRLAASEVFLLLEAEAADGRATPQIFPVEGHDLVLIFDREDRLTGFAEGAAPYLALSGRALVEMLAGQNLGVGINLGVAPSSMVLDAEAISWLAGTLAEAPDELQAKAEELTAPFGLPDRLLEALDARLASAAGLAKFAYLVGVRYAAGGQGHLMAFVETAPGAEAALAQTVSEALTFSGIEAGVLDVAFFKASDPMSARLARVGLRFDLPEPAEAQTVQVGAPGTDPNKPPKLR